jgi:hypothetical protein
LYAQKVVTLVDDPNDVRARAEAKFAKAQKAAQEGEKAWAEHNTAARAVRDKTSRLRAARLAKEAAEIEAEDQTIKKPAARRKKPSR